MDATADPSAQLTAAQAGKQPHKAEPTADGPGVGEGGSPSLTLDGFNGPLDHLLALARSEKIDLAEISLAALIDQLVTALRQALANMPLGQKGDWVVMAAWLVQLRSRLLLAAGGSVQEEAATEVDQLRTRLVALADIQALVGWLERRRSSGRTCLRVAHRRFSE
jgi:segregation and condensation protein A